MESCPFQRLHYRCKAGSSLHHSNIMASYMCSSPPGVQAGTSAAELVMGALLALHTPQRQLGTAHIRILYLVADGTWLTATRPS